MSVREQSDSPRVPGPFEPMRAAGAGAALASDAAARMHAGGASCQRQAGRHAETSAPGNADAPWDEVSAEALMRVCEAADAEPVAVPPRPHAQEAAAATHTPAAGALDRPQGAALEARIVAFAASLGQWLGRLDPEKSLAMFHQRLAEFEQRLATALGKLASCGDASALTLIEAQVRDLNAQVAAARKELGRLEAIDTQLGTLARLLERQQGQRDARVGGVGQDALDTVAQAAADRAVRQFALQAPDDDARNIRWQQIIASLEQLQRCMAERRVDEKGSVRALQGIEDALAHIVARIASIKDAAESQGPDDSVGLAAESDRLAEAYAAGTRALGQQPFALDAADYAAANAQEWAGARDATREAGGGRRWRTKMTHGGTEGDAAGNARTPTRDQPRHAPHVMGLAHWKSVLPIAVTLLLAGGYFGIEARLARGSDARAMSPAPAAHLSPSLSAPGANAEHLQGSAGEAAHPQSGAAFDAARASVKGALGGALALAAGAAAPAGGATDGPDLPVAIGPPAPHQAALAGSPVAPFALAAGSGEGSGIAEDLQRAALRGHGPAQFQLGMRFEHGWGVAIDLEQAKAWYRRAAEQGVARAMHNLAVLTIGRDKREADYVAAAPWFRAAADRGLSDSQFNLAVLYENGLGIARDPAAAYFWYTLAAQSGDKEAAQRLEHVAPLLTADQLLGTERQAIAWRPAAQ